MGKIYEIFGNDAHAMTMALMEKADIASAIPQGASIGLKPNLVLAGTPESGATTHPGVLSGCIEYLQNHGFHNISVMEGSWVGDQTGRAYKICGYDKVCRKYNVPFYDLKHDDTVTVETELRPMEISRRAWEVDYLINLPVLKVHCQTTMTCALKNCKGCLPDREKRRFHTEGLMKPIAALAAALRPNLIIVDSICGDLNFEEGGTPVQTNRMYLGTDAVQIDAYGCRLMGIDPADVPYSISVLSNLLKNRKYIGEYKYGDVIIPDGIPAIIDKELFERVQTRMAANKKAPARAKAEEEYLLTTKLYCGECGRLMAGESGKGCKGVVYHYYKCSGAKRKLGCKKKAIRKDWIEDVVVKFTVTHVLTDTAIDRIADAIVIMQEQEDTMTPVLKQQLQQCESEIRNVMKAIRQGIITETTKECLEDLETQRDSLKTSIAQLALERRKFTKEEIVEWISRYKDGNINDPDYRREIIDTFVNSVYVYDDKLLLTYNYRDGSQTLTLKEIEAALSSDLTSMCPP